MHAAYEMSIPVVYTRVIEVLLLFLEILNLEFLLSMWVQSLCSSIYVCFVIFVILRNERLESY